MSRFRLRSSPSLPSLVTALLLAACGGDHPAASGAQGLADGGRADAAARAPILDFGAFDATVEQFLKDKGLAGASAIVVHIVRD
jgi:hypothetical protein